MSPARFAAPRCNGANRDASPRPARGARPPRRDHRSWPARGRVRTGRSHRSGWRPRSCGSCPPPRRSVACRTAPGRAPPGCSASRARRPTRAPAAARPRPGCPAPAGPDRAGKAYICLLARVSADRPSQAFRRNGNPGRLKILLTYVQIPPSSPASAGQAALGLELMPFRGVRYAQDRVSGLAEVTSPPYDVIFRDKEDQLMAADPHNVVRLILPRPVPGRPGEEYHDAAVSLRQWQDEHILVTDPAPALYLYEQSAAPGPEAGWVQRGLIGAIRLVAPDAGIVLPHEDVSPGPVAGRLALMEATQANLEPIFLLYDGHSGTVADGATPDPRDGAVGATAMIIAEIAGSCEGASPRQPLISTRTSDGLAHTLWAITD